MAMGVPSAPGGRGRTRRRAPMAEINVTPLVDVMLVLMIIFMITAPLLMASVPVNLPDSRAQPVQSQEQDPIQLTIQADGALFLGDQPVSDAALPGRLQAIALEDAGAEKPRQIMLRADGALAYAKVASVLGELNRAGLTRVALVTNGSDAAP